MQAQPVSSLTLQFLLWVAAAPRSYGEVMDAWRSTCPRMTVWEDAVSDGLVKLEPNGSMNNATVSLTARGRNALQLQAATATAEAGLLASFPAKLKTATGKPIPG